MINKGKLNELAILQNDLQSQTNALTEENIRFGELHKDLIDSIKLTGEAIEHVKSELTVEGLEEFKETEKKQLSGGLGIRVSTKLEYELQSAMNWAEYSMPIIIERVLNKKKFESYAKAEDLNFVNKKEKIIVTFPKEIKVILND